MEKSYIWTLATRVFHWLLALFILLSFITSDIDDFLNYHVIVGYAVLILIFYRIVWGIIGPKFSQFKDFPLSKKNVKEFLSNMFNSEQKYVGHNPMASYVMISMFLIIFLIILTGAIAFGIEEGKGIFSSFKTGILGKNELFEDIHEILSNLLIVLIVAHLSGVLFDKIFHKKHETLKSIFSGYKKTKYLESVELNIFQKIVATTFLILFITFLIYSFINPENILLG